MDDFTQALLRCRENPAKFRPLDALRLNRGNPLDPPFIVRSKSHGLDDT